MLMRLVVETQKTDIIALRLRSAQGESNSYL